MSEAALARGMQRMLARTRRAQEGGAPRAGWKVAVNLRSVQERLGLEGPLVCALDGARVLPSGARVRVPRAERRALEAEVAVRIGRDVAPDASPAQAAACVAALAPAFEVVAPDRATPDLEALVADGVLHVATVLGDETPPPDAPLAALAPRLRADGRDLGSDVLEPAGWPESLGALVAGAGGFLARYGEGLRAGDLLLSGSFTRPRPARPGERVEAIFATLGAVAVEIGSAEEECEA